MVAKPVPANEGPETPQEESSENPDLEEETLRSLISLQISDIDSVITNHKGKHRATDPTPDDLTAFETYRLLLEDASHIPSDLRFALSLDAALEADAELLYAISAEEAQSIADHNLAVALSEGKPAPPPSQTSGAASSSKQPSKKPVFLETECVICRDSRYCQPAPCGDAYCHLCLREVFLRACDDEELFPPRCCTQPIPLEQAQVFLTREEIDRYKGKVEEYTSGNRVYCADGACSAFISAGAIIGDKAGCKVCGKETCRICGKGWHGEADCPEDKELELTLAHAKEMGWQRCGKCHALVERKHGCEHMTCRCRAEWCYRCGVQWKQCECGDWVPEMLAERAEQLAVREVGRDAAHAEPQRVQQRAIAIQQNLRINHECVHDGRWRYINSPDEQCEVCYCRLPLYIFSCRGCGLYACWRCRKNRI